MLLPLGIVVVELYHLNLAQDLVVTLRLYVMAILKMYRDLNISNIAEELLRVGQPLIGVVLGNLGRYQKYNKDNNIADLSAEK
ncbi:unnamed protein product [Meloidogyne enterolobii]|uniref:Uncharacterized protein n=1 Tax=Meloidogyne enterolobii TaxID=390850 RepID=A0ACB1AR63_MELEN